MNTYEKRGRGAPLPGLAALANQIPAAARPHARGVQRHRWNIAAFTGAVRVAPAVHRHRHLPAQNDVRGFRRMRVIGIGRVRRILPDVGVAEAFPFKSSLEFLFVHWIILANTRRSER